MLRHRLPVIVPVLGLGRARLADEAVQGRNARASAGDAGGDGSRRGGAGKQGQDAQYGADDEGDKQDDRGVQGQERLQVLRSGHVSNLHHTRL